MSVLIVRSSPTMEMSADVRRVAESLPNPKAVMGYWYKRCLRGIHQDDIPSRRIDLRGRGDDVLGNDVLGARHISPNVDVYLAYVNDIVSGVAIVNSSSSPHPEDVADPEDEDEYVTSTLELIIVNPSIQGCGIGSKLLHSIIPAYSSLILEVSADNHRAIELYRRFGFRMIDARGDYIVMRRLRR